MNTKIRALFTNLRHDERGLTTVEYVIVLCLIAAMAVASWKSFGAEVDGYLTGATEKISDNVEASIEP